jgi:hypothetical protein
MGEGALFGLFYQLRMMDDNECESVDLVAGAVRSTLRNAAPVPFCAPQIAIP